MERIGIIGDVHAEHRRLETALDLFEKKKVDLLLCTGDLADGRGDLDACCSMLIHTGALVVAGNHDRWFLDRIATHILAFEGESNVTWFEGNYQEYERDRKKRMGEDANTPKRIKYKKLTR